MTGPFGYPSFAHRQPCPTAIQLNEAAANRLGEHAGYVPLTHSDETPDYAVSAHGEAAAKLLCAVVRQLRTGTPPEELGAQVALIGVMMERRI